MNAMLLECCAGAAKIMKCGCNLEAATNCQDVAIAGTICSAIVRMTIIIVAGVLLWKLMGYLFSVCQEHSTKKNDAKVSDRKQTNDVLDKYFDFLKDLSYPYDKDKDGNHVKREYDGGNSTKYIEALESYLQKEGVLKP